jgi:hypothetical protein
VPRKPKQAADDGLTLHTTFRLPRELHELLIKAAAEHRYGIGEEIRRRLEASFAAAPSGGDLKTQALITSIKSTADQVWSLNSFHHWHEDAFSFAAFKHALHKVLEVLLQKPPGEAKIDPYGLGGSIWEDGVSPEEVGNAVAANAIGLSRQEHKP